MKAKVRFLILSNWFIMKYNNVLHTNIHTYMSYVYVVMGKVTARCPESLNTYLLHNSLALMLYNTIYLTITRTRFNNNIYYQGCFVRVKQLKYVPHLGSEFGNGKKRRYHGNKATHMQHIPSSVV